MCLDSTLTPHFLSLSLPSKSSFAEPFWSSTTMHKDPSVFAGQDEKRQKKEMQKRRSIENKTGLQPVSKTVELLHYLKGRGLVQSHFDVKAVQTVTLLAVLICKVYITITNFH